MIFQKVVPKDKVHNFYNIILYIVKNNLNSLLLKKFTSINKLPLSKKLKQLKPLFENNNIRVSSGTFTPEQKYQINYTNKYFFNKLKSQHSVFDLNEWEKDFKKSQNYKKNICAYPSIDFHKAIQRKIEKEKNENQKIYYNTAVNFSKNLFNKTKFKDVKIYKPKTKKNDKKIDNEHFMNGETEIQNDDREFEIYFIINDNEQNKKIKIEKCKKDDFFFDIVDKLCQNESSINKERIKVDEFTISGRKDGNEYIDYHDTLEGNKLEGNEEIIVKFKDDENEIKKINN